MYALKGADSNVSKKKLAMSGGGSSNRDNLDREPASPGEQVCYMLCTLYLLLVLLMVGVFSGIYRCEPS